MAEVMGFFLSIREDFIEALIGVTVGSISSMFFLSIREDFIEARSS